jgi:hypothetical protein
MLLIRPTYIITQAVVSPSGKVLPDRARCDNAGDDYGLRNDDNDPDRTGGKDVAARRALSQHSYSGYASGHANALKCAAPFYEGREGGLLRRLGYFGNVDKRRARATKAVQAASFSLLSQALATKLAPRRAIAPVQNNTYTR